MEGEMSFLFIEERPCSHLLIEGISCAWDKFKRCVQVLLYLGTNTIRFLFLFARMWVICAQYSCFLDSYRVGHVVPLVTFALNFYT